MGVQNYTDSEVTLNFGSGVALKLWWHSITIKYKVQCKASCNLLPLDKHPQLRRKSTMHMVITHLSRIHTDRFLIG